MVLLDNGGRHFGEIDLRRPPGDLEGLVAHLWIQSNPHATGDWRVVPDPSPHLVAKVTGRATPRISVVLIGPRSQAASIQTANRILTAGIRLNPGALPVLTGHSAREFVDQSLEIDEVFNRKILEGLELGHDAPPRLLLEELVRLLRRASSHRSMKRFLADEMWHVRTVGQLSGTFATPTRTLRDIAYREVGLNPKRILRILRLHSALRMARSSTARWSHVAHAAGYADQAHFSREARELLGETPSKWAARGSAVLFKT